MDNKEKFKIKLPLFEGPFDLLLFFIERDELNIYDIPIAKITSDFLEYLNHVEKMNIEIASEFIIMASTLMKIKSKTLLPRPVVDEENNEIDPRDELVQHLLEYKKYKSIALVFSQWEEERMKKYSRGGLHNEVYKLSKITNVEAELQDVNLYKMMRVFQKVIQRIQLQKNKPTHQIVHYPFSVDGQKKLLLKRLTNTSQLSFETLIEENPDRVLVIFNFLAILELIQIKTIVLHLGENYNNFWIKINNKNL